jgi:hypothetical protein
VQGDEPLPQDLAADIQGPDEVRLLEVGVQVGGFRGSLPPIGLPQPGRPREGHSGRLEMPPEEYPADGRRHGVRQRNDR